MYFLKLKTSGCMKKCWTIFMFAHLQNQSLLLLCLHTILEFPTTSSLLYIEMENDMIVIPSHAIGKARTHTFSIDRISIGRGFSKHM